MRTNLESVENTERENHNEALIEQSVLMEPSNSSSSKSSEDTKEGIREINGQEGTFGTSKSTEGNSELVPDIKLKELHEATLDDFSNQLHEAEAKDISVVSKALDAVFDHKQTESSTNTGNLEAHADIKVRKCPWLFTGKTFRGRGKGQGMCTSYPPRAMLYECNFVSRTSFVQQDKHTRRI